MARTGRGSRGYTLVEMLVATTLTLVMMGAVASVFGMIGESVTSARATLELSDALRSAMAQLRGDLGGIANTGLVVSNPPPTDHTANVGYFEYTEGPIGPVVTPGYVARNLDVPRTPAPGPPPDPDQLLYVQDPTAGDSDDMLMFTTRTIAEQFVGRSAGSNGYVECADAEVAWFVRGRTLYRRVLLVAPSDFLALDVYPSPPNNDGRVGQGDVSLLASHGVYELFDISVRPAGTDSGGYQTWVGNNLGDLTRPENRFAHQSGAFPYHPHTVSGWAASGTPAYALARLNLPLLQECSDATWVAGGPLSANGGLLVTIGLNTNVQTATNTSAPPPFDAWLNPHPWEPASGTLPIVDKATGVLTNTSGVALGTRIAEDVILNNVLSFDVKAWDPGAPILLAVNDNGTPYSLSDDTLMVPTTVVLPGDAGYPLALLHLTNQPFFTPIGFGAYADLGYYTANPSYSAFAGNGAMESLGLVRVYDTWSTHYASNGIDENGVNGPDDPAEALMKPYPVGLRGIQVKIRVFEPGSRQIRELTIVHDFLPK